MPFQSKIVLELFVTFITLKFVKLNNHFPLQYFSDSFPTNWFLTLLFFPRPFLLMNTLTRIFSFTMSNKLIIIFKTFFASSALVGLGFSAGIPYFLMSFQRIIVFELFKTFITLVFVKYSCPKAFFDSFSSYRFPAGIHPLLMSFQRIIVPEIFKAVITLIFVWHSWP